MGLSASICLELSSVPPFSLPSLAPTSVESLPVHSQILTLGLFSYVHNYLPGICFQSESSRGHSLSIFLFKTFQGLTKFPLSLGVRARILSLAPGVLHEEESVSPPALCWHGSLYLRQHPCGV